jgi:hypothetical protein
VPGLAAGAELEVGVQLVAGHSPVFARCKDDQVLARGQQLAGKEPLIQLAGVIGQRPARKVDGCGRGIANLDPIGALAVFVDDPGVVGGQ